MSPSDIAEDFRRCCADSSQMIYILSDETVPATISDSTTILLSIMAQKVRRIFVHGVIHIILTLICNIQVAPNVHTISQIQLKQFRRHAKVKKIVLFLNKKRKVTICFVAIGGRGRYCSVSFGLKKFNPIADILLSRFSIDNYNTRIDVLYRAFETYVFVQIYFVSDALNRTDASHL